MKIGLFGGSFDPIHIEHIRLAEAAVRCLKLDKLIFIPSYRAPHKELGAVASGEDRLELCRIACKDLPFAEVSDLEIKAEGTSYTYLTCNAYAKQYPRARLFFLVGADMLDNFFYWKNPEEILKCVKLVACGRGEHTVSDCHKRFRKRFKRDFRELDVTGKDISSTDLRVALAFGNDAEASAYLTEEVFQTIKERNLYRYPEIEGALSLLTPERRAHSERVARMAAKRARSLKIPEEKAISAAMLHDCGKYVPLDSPLLQGFVPPERVPDPVLHQFTGAYIAEHTFGVKDPDILNAVRYHTSGRDGMSPLEKLIYLADLLEEGRSYEGVEPLRKLFWADLDACLYDSLEHQLTYLRERGERIYPLTRAAFEWLKWQSRYFE